jgi:hypothetical protein
MVRKRGIVSLNCGATTALKKRLIKTKEMRITEWAQRPHYNNLNTPLSIILDKNRLVLLSTIQNLEVKRAPLTLLIFT